MLNNVNVKAFLETYGLKIIGHGNPDNNLESPCRSVEKHIYTQLLHPEKHKKT
jgi:hypothetical protein